MPSHLSHASCVGVCVTCTCNGCILNIVPKSKQLGSDSCIRFKLFAILLQHMPTCWTAWIYICINDLWKIDIYNAVGE